LSATLRPSASLSAFLGFRPHRVWHKEALPLAVGFEARSDAPKRLPDSVFHKN
jgi:hypothetical protein